MPGQQQVNENAAAAARRQSSQRCENGSGGARNTSTYRQAAPTPDGENNRARRHLRRARVIVISQLYGGGGNAGATYQQRLRRVVQSRGGDRSTSPAGRCNTRRPPAAAGTSTSSRSAARSLLASTYLISLASGEQRRAAAGRERQRRLDQHVCGTSGKIALVDNFDGVGRHLPEIQRPSDGPGWLRQRRLPRRHGNGARHRGATPIALLPPQAGGATDTDRNGDDFVTGSPNPRRTAPDCRTRTVCRDSEPRVNATDAPRDATHPDDLHRARQRRRSVVQHQLRHHRPARQLHASRRRAEPLHHAERELRAGRAVHCHDLQGSECTIRTPTTRRPNTDTMPAELLVVVHGRHRHRAAVSGECAPDDGQPDRRDGRHRAAQ